MIVLRHADDIVVGFEREADARRFWDEMRERLQEFSLSLHPEKTRLIEFGRLAATNRARRGLGKPETFNVLGLTFICGRNSRGKFLLCRKTRRDRRRAKLGEIKEELRRRMRQPVPEQGDWLKQVVSGFNAYHAAPTNGRALRAFREHVKTLWYRTLRRRSQRDRTTWERLKTLADEWLPEPLILHPWPSNRFAVKHPRRGDLGRKVQKPLLDYRGRLLLSRACRCIMAAAGVQDNGWPCVGHNGPQRNSGEKVFPLRRPWRNWPPHQKDRTWHASPILPPPPFPRVAAVNRKQPARLPGRPLQEAATLLRLKPPGLTLSPMRSLDNLPRDGGVARRSSAPRPRSPPCSRPTQRSSLWRTLIRSKPPWARPRPRTTP